MIVLKYKKKDLITQMQITDYIFGVKKYVYMMNIQKDYRTAMKLIYSVPRKPKQKRGRKKGITKLFYKIDHFIKNGDLTPIKPQYLRRFRDVAVVPESEINYEGISQIEKLMLKALSGFTSFFKHIIICNNFSYFDDLQETLEIRDISFKNRFLYDIIIFELSRIHIGIDNYTSYLNAIRFFKPIILKPCFTTQTTSLA